MKFDMHCHTAEGSIDGKVPLEQYIELLKEKGFGGMLITDHNSYNAFRHWKNNLKGKKHRDFVVLKGIEYDTINAGHILVIMPQNVKPRILEVRGMPLNLLVSVVHRYGGILGPAHPCGEKHMSFCNAKAYKRARDKNEIIRKFDFLETFNACEDKEVNERARNIARENFLPGFGGSDAHRADCVGLAYTELPDSITCETDLIEHVKEKRPMKAGGTFYHGTTKEKIGKVSTVLAYSFWVYNKTAGLIRKPKRKGRSEKVDYNSPQVPDEVSMDAYSSNCKED